MDSGLRGPEPVYFSFSIRQHPAFKIQSGIDACTTKPYNTRKDSPESYRTAAAKRRLMFPCRQL